MQPPQSRSRAEEDAAVRLASAVYQAATRRPPEPEQALRLGVMAHYAFSAAVGVGYAIVGRRFPLIRRARGGVYGTLVWALADEGVVPALGLSRAPRALEPGLHAYALLGHWVYGATLEGVRRAAEHSR
jgi:uncharacterized membrane protein YagU involved in acid resistance